MDLEAARQSLSKKRSAFSTKKIAFLAVVGVVVVVGIALRAGHESGEAPAESEAAAVDATAPAVPAAPAPAPEVVPSSPAQTTSVPPTPPAQATEPVAEPAPAEAEAAVTDPEPSGEPAANTEPEGEAVEQAEEADFPGAGRILVSRKPVQVLASPSASAPAMYGFPAGRPFRVIGREGGFVQIQDLRSSAKGWIDEGALALPPPSAPGVAAPSQPKPSSAGQKPATASANPKPDATSRKPATASANPKPKPAKKNAPAVAESEPAAEPDSSQARRPPTLFGRGGFFGGVFGGGNAN